MPPYRLKQDKSRLLEDLKSAEQKAGEYKGLLAKQEALTEELKHQLTTWVDTAHALMEIRPKRPKKKKEAAAAAEPVSAAAPAPASRAPKARAAATCARVLPGASAGRG